MVDAEDPQAVQLRALGHGRGEEDVGPVRLLGLGIGLESRGVSAFDDPVGQEDVRLDGRSEGQDGLAHARDRVSHVTAGAVLGQLPFGVQEVLFADRFRELEMCISAGLAGLHDGVEPTWVGVGYSPLD